MSYRIFTLSPGSTSTKCAVFEDGEIVFKENIVHPKEELDKFETVNDQRPFRVAEVRRVINANGFRLRDMDAYAAYSGGLESTPVGAYLTCDKTCDGVSLKNQRMRESEYTPMSSSAPPASLRLKNRFVIL